MDAPKRSSHTVWLVVGPLLVVSCVLLAWSAYRNVWPELQRHLANRVAVYVPVRKAIVLLLHLAMDGVHKLHRQLSPEVCRQWLATLQRFQAEREPIEEIEYRESVRWEYAGGVALRMVESTRKSLGKDFSLGSEAPKDFGLYHAATLRLLIRELALQIFRAEHVREAGQLEDLVPDVLPAVPLDPFTGQPLVYRPTADGPLLYSLGYDRRDDGGRPLENGRGNIRLDDPQQTAEP